MKKDVFSSPSTGPAGPVTLGAGLLLLIVSPVIRGGNRGVAMILLEMLGLVLLLALVPKLLQPTTGRRPVSALALFLAFSPLWIALVQLMPMPTAVWASLPGREVYLSALSAVQIPPGAWRPLSLVPDATWISVLAGLPLAAAFLLAQVVSHRQLLMFVHVIVLFTVPQVIFGLLQVSLFRQLYFDAVAYGRAIGSFANPNHFASYIVMTLPLTILLLRQALKAGGRHGVVGRRTVSGSRGHGRRSLQGSNPLMPAVWGVVLFLQLAALLASQSRAGLGVGVLVAVAAVLLLSAQALSRRGWWLRVAGVVGVCVLVAATVGVEGLFSRITGSGAEDGRWLMLAGTWQGVRAFWPAGSGLGSFGNVFPRFQPAGLSGYVEYAHSDVLQLLMECGLLFVVLAGMALWLLGARGKVIVRGLRADPSDMTAAVLASCGLGLLAVTLHSLVDFNLHIPANAILAAFLMGAFLRLQATDAQVEMRRPSTDMAGH